MTKKKIIIMSIVGLLVIVIAFLFITKPGDASVAPPTVTANFMDIDKIDKISKFRSCQGHTVVPQDESETKRNMKHYVILKKELWGGGGKIAVYAPFDGRVAGIRSEKEKGLEGEISFSVGGSRWEVSYLHLDVLDGVKKRQKVKSGQIIGYASDKGVDVVYSTGGGILPKNINGYYSPYGKLDSIFNHMSADLLAQYQAKGISQTDMNYSKEFRDASPCEYVENSPNEAQLNDFAHPEDWVKIN